MKRALLRKVFNQQTLFWFVFSTFVVSTAYVVFRLIVAPAVEYPGDLDMRVKGDYTLMLLQCVLGTLSLLLPSFVAHRFKIIIPSGMIVAYAIFLYCAIFLGEVRSFYYAVPHWDKILHISSGFMLGALGFTLISFLNKAEKIPIALSPLFVAIFTFCFAVTMGVIWEIYEFTIDIIFGTNTQKYALENGTLLVGQAALADTMWDLIVDTIGALAFSIFGYISLTRKKNQGLLDKLVFKRRKIAKSQK
ncbi:hypothetical protein FWH09_00555 [Candidatus Saccharibacteria bacterium]|nr:hypothetical protein [Candidatus Saccharibacteria bacterium]